MLRLWTGLDASLSTRFRVSWRSYRLVFWQGGSNRSCEHNGETARDAKNLLRAGELAERLNVPESWVRTEERAGRIPSIRLRKYVRFKLNDVERALAERRRQGE
jgi:excisionase family DNA binding protein